MKGITSSFSTYLIDTKNIFDFNLTARFNLRVFLFDPIISCLLLFRLSKKVRNVVAWCVFFQLGN